MTLSVLIVCSLGELKDVTMTTTFKRHVELLEVVVFEGDIQGAEYRGGRKNIHKQKMMLL